MQNGGNVGIGTNTPAEALHVSGGNIVADRGNATGVLTRTLTLGGAREFSGDFARVDFRNYDVDSGAADYVGASIASFNSGNSDDGDLRFSTATDTILSERMRITHEGNVGIGTNAPAEQLDVTGNIKASGTIQSGSSITIDGTTDTITSSGPLTVAGGVFESKSNCCVDIGEKGCDDAACETAVCAAVPSCCTFKWDGECAGAANTLCSVCNQTGIILQADLVGVGTTTPTTPLAIMGNGGTDPVGITQNAVGGSATMELTTEDSGGNQATRILLRGAIDTADIEFYTGASGAETQTLHIEGNNGNVGIGTTTPGEKLDVIGEIRYDTGAPDPFYPAAYDRKTVMVAGRITQAGDIDLSVTSSDAIASATRESAGDYTVTFVADTFSKTPIITVTPLQDAGGDSDRHAVIKEQDANSFKLKIKKNGNDQNSPFNFIAIGER